MGQLDAIKEAEHALLRAHAALKEAAKIDPTDGLRVEALYQRNELALRRMASDLNELHATTSEADYLAERAG